MKPPRRHPRARSRRGRGASCWAAGALSLSLALAAGCAGIKPTDGPTGTGNSNGGGGQRGVNPDAGVSCKQEVLAVVRDFRGFTVDPSQPKHPDFEFSVGPLTGIVAPTIGADAKPVYAPAGPTAVTNGPDTFNQWYRDVPGVNIRFDNVAIPLTEDPARKGVFVYDNDAFFPIDDQGWGNQYQGHNFDFTTEIHFNFPYRGGEVFTFRGDDDVWVFVNGHLAIDLGGVHEAETGTVDLDQQASALGIVAGQSYRMDIFQAERHVIYSTFHIETTLACVDNVIIP